MEDEEEGSFIIQEPIEPDYEPTEEGKYGQSTRIV